MTKVSTRFFPSARVDFRHWYAPELVTWESNLLRFVLITWESNSLRCVLQCVELFWGGIFGAQDYVQCDFGNLGNLAFPCSEKGMQAIRTSEQLWTAELLQLQFGAQDYLHDQYTVTYRTNLR